MSDNYLMNYTTYDIENMQSYKDKPPILESASREIRIFKKFN